MNDLKLNSEGDLFVSDTGDIALTESICQAVNVRLRWIFEEWRLGPELGFRWFEEVFVKNPQIERIKQLIRDEILKVDGVTDALVTDVVISRQNRAVSFKYRFITEEELFEQEVTINE